MFMLRVLHTVPYSNEPRVSDVTAALHSFLTCNLLVACALLLSYRQFGGKPIECMVPPEYTNAWVQYAENYCFSQESYFVPFTTALAGLNETDKGDQRVSYYQWMAFFLLFEAGCFKIPCLIWKYFASQSGMRIGEIIRLSQDEANGVPDVKKTNVNALSVHLNGALRFHKILTKRRVIPHKVLRFLNVKYSTYYVTLIYFIAKLGFLVNVCAQVKLLERYVLPTPENSLGFSVWQSLITGNETWKENGIFPRVTLCDFEVREMGNIQTHTVQCLLLMNMFTEKVFLILWAWYMVLSWFTLLNCLSWVWAMFSETSQLHFLLSHLDMRETPSQWESEVNNENVGRFLNLYLGKDGMLILYLVAQHSDVVFTTELIGELWKSFTQIESMRRAAVETDQAMTALKNIPEHREKRRITKTFSLEDLSLSNNKFADSSSDEDQSKGKNSKNSSRRSSKAKNKEGKDGHSGHIPQSPALPSKLAGKPVKHSFEGKAAE